MAEIDDLRAEVAHLKATVEIAGAALNVEIKRRQDKDRESTNLRNNLMRMTADRDDLLEKNEALAAELRQFRLLGDAVVDLCWKATPTGYTTDGDVSAYILPKGTVHRLIGAAQCAGVRAAFRDVGVWRKANPSLPHESGVGCACQSTLRDELRKAVAVASEVPDSKKRRMPTLRPITGDSDR